MQNYKREVNNCDSLLCDMSRNNITNVTKISIYFSFTTNRPTIELTEIYLRLHSELNCHCLCQEFY